MITKSVYNPLWDNLLFGAIIIGLIFLTVMVIQKPGQIKLVTIPLLLTGVVIIGQLGMRIMFGNTDVQTNLSEIESNDESNPKSDTEQIFKFEYNELYESGKLITEKGSYYKLSKEDVKFLKERGAH